MRYTRPTAVMQLDSKVTNQSIQLNDDCHPRERFLTPAAASNGKR